MKKTVMILSALILLPVVASAQFDAWGGRHLGEAVANRQKVRRQEKAAAEKAQKEAAEQAKIEAEAKRAALEAQADQEAQEAEDYLRVLIKYNGNFKEELEKIIKLHRDIVERIMRNRTVWYGGSYWAVQGLEDAVKKLNYEPLKEKVQHALEHQYYLRDYKKDELISYKQMTKAIILEQEKAWRSAGGAAR